MIEEDQRIFRVNVLFAIVSVFEKHAKSEGKINDRTVFTMNDDQAVLVFINELLKIAVTEFRSRVDVDGNQEYYFYNVKKKEYDIEDKFGYTQFKGGWYIYRVEGKGKIEMRIDNMDEFNI